MLLFRWGSHSAWNQILAESGSLEYDLIVATQGFPHFGLPPQGRWPIMSKIDAHLSFLYIDTSLFASRHVPTRRSSAHKLAPGLSIVIARNPEICLESYSV